MKNKLKALFAFLFSLFCFASVQNIVFAENTSNYSFDMNTAVRQADNTDFIFPAVGIAVGIIIFGAVLLIRRYIDKK